MTDFNSGGMQSAPQPQEKPASEEVLQKASHEPNIIDTNSGKNDGLSKCPKCGSSEISYDIKAQTLACDFCRNTWNELLAVEAFGLDSAISDLSGLTMGSGSQDITAGNDVTTIKCQGCGAEIVLQTSEALQAKCHWCRQTLSINSQIPNGAIPDAILPFKVTHARAVKKIQEFVDERKFFALKKFKEEFSPETVMGVYMPYMVIDANMTAMVTGSGEIETARRTRTDSDGDTETLYDADEYKISRAFNAHIDDLTTESSQERADYKDTAINTNNIINAILPFDTKEAFVYNGNYLKQFTSEKRDLSVPELMEGNVTDQLLSIARSKATEMSPQYDRGIRWEHEGVEIHGSRWVTMYLPVWLYSYYTPNSNGQGGMVHYIAVNGRTGKTMGSVPVNKNLITGVAVAAGVATAIPCWGILFGGALL